MTNKLDYPIATGDADYERWTLLSKLYNPVTYAFLKDSGLTPGMKVLHIGCGVGHLTAWLAQQVTRSGEVIAVDNSLEQLELAKKTAKIAGVDNIKFLHLDIRNIDNLTEKFDFIYGRAVIEYIPDERNSIFEKLYHLLNNGGILSYESVSACEPAHFSYPHQPILDDYFLMNKNFFINSVFSANLQSELYSLFKKLDCKNIALQTNQPVLSNPEEKSVVRLGILNTRTTVCQQLSDKSFEALAHKLAEIEQDDFIIIGYLRSLLIKGCK